VAVKKPSLKSPTKKIARKSKVVPPAPQPVSPTPPAPSTTI
jgi:hypothetical protein